jgi:alkyl sulfatase BDS1-like metallo-beta-lactamase superfamily hydrolase
LWLSVDSERLAGPGTTISAGAVTLIPPAGIIRKTGETHVTDGLGWGWRK